MENLELILVTQTRHNYTTVHVHQAFYLALHTIFLFLE
jgi:hypothetical protein